ncbi:hypothetical protein OIU78_001362 [Salix suchowensis]|nr:hypothetical protein OIU78_001362 [Salix suchowensis]
MIRHGLLLRSPSSSRRVQPLLKETTGSKMVPGGDRRERNLARAKTRSFGEVAGWYGGGVCGGVGLSREEGWGKEVREIMEKGKCCDHHNRDPNGETEAVDLEKEMWDQFNSTGFWRSPSRRGT